MHRNRAILAVTCACLLAGCAGARSLWPFGQQAAPAAAAVNELVVAMPQDSAPQVVLQFWERDTLVVDLQNVTTTGQLVLGRREGHLWPARIAFRMAPARFEAIEVRGAQRVVVPVSPGAGTVTAALPPGVYADATPELNVRWGNRSSF